MIKQSNCVLKFDKAQLAMSMLTESAALAPVIVTTCVEQPFAQRGLIASVTDVAPVEGTIVSCEPMVLEESM
jgi:hypothetical protein